MIGDFVGLGVSTVQEGDELAAVSAMRHLMNKLWDGTYGEEPEHELIEMYDIGDVVYVTIDLGDGRYAQVEVTAKVIHTAYWKNTE